MEIKGSLPSHRPLSNRTINLKQLRVGQILRAVVIQTSADKTALLQVKNQSLRVETQAPLSRGQRIEMEVVQIDPKPLLRLKSAPPPAPALSQVLTSALQQALPKQAGLPPLLANLNFLNQAQQRSAGALPAPILEAIKRVIKSLPQRSQVTTAAGLKEAVKNSGLFLERTLASSQRGKASPQNDLKALLIQLLTRTKEFSRGESTAPTATSAKPALTTLLPARELSPTFTPAPPPRPALPQPQGGVTASAQNLGGNLSQLIAELGKQTEGALARLNLLQLTTLQQQDQTSPNWILELPVQNQNQTDLFHLIVDEQTTRQKEAAQKRWEIMLSFDLDGLGPIYVNLKYVDEQIMTTIWAENEKTATLVRQEMNELSRRFKQAGVDGVNLCCHHGEPPPAASGGVSQTVLDIRV